MAVAQVVSRQHQLGGNRLRPIHFTTAAECRGIAVALEQVDRHFQPMARRDECPVLDVSRLPEHPHTLSVTVGQPHQPGCRFDQRLQLQHAGHDRERRKVIRQILLGQSQMLDRSDGLSLFDGQDPVHEVEAHNAARGPGPASCGVSGGKVGIIRAPFRIGNPEQWQDFRRSILAKTRIVCNLGGLRSLASPGSPTACAACTLRPEWSARRMRFSVLR